MSANWRGRERLTQLSARKPTVHLGTIMYLRLRAIAFNPEAESVLRKLEAKLVQRFARGMLQPLDLVLNH
jgi:hypothetical protein